MADDQQATNDAARAAARTADEAAAVDDDGDDGDIVQETAVVALQSLSKWQTFRKCRTNVWRAIQKY